MNRLFLALALTMAVPASAQAYSGSPYQAPNSGTPHTPQPYTNPYASKPNSPANIGYRNPSYNPNKSPTSSNTPADKYTLPKGTKQY